MKKYYFLITFLFLSFSVFAQSITLPFVEDFESGQNGWTAGGTGSTWTFGTPNKLGMTSAPSGSNAWVLGGLADSYYQYESSWVKSPEYDLSLANNPRIEAKINYTLANVSGEKPDSVRMQYSIDQGASWVTITEGSGDKNWYATAWTGSTNRNVITIEALVSELANQSSVIFRLHFGNGSTWISGKGGFIFDDFSIYDYPIVDLQLEALIKEPESRYFTNAESIDVVLFNKGSNTISSSFDLSYTVNGSATQTETFNVAIPAFESDTLTFASTEDLSASGNYNFSIWASNFVGDTIQTNDSLRKTVRKYQHVQLSLPFLSEFENYVDYYGNQSVKAVSNNPEYELKVFSEGYNQRLMTYSSTEMGGDRHLYMRASNTIQHLIGHFDLSTYSVASDDLLLSFISTDSESSPFGPTGTKDELAIRGSKNDPWILIDSLKSSTVKTYAYGISSILRANGQDFSSSFQIRIINKRWHDLQLDNIGIEIMDDNDLSIISQSIPNSRDHESSEVLTAQILNYGAQAQSNFDISYQLNDQPIVTETVTNTVSSLDTLNYTFISTLDLSAIAAYDLKIWTSLSSDTIQVNDSLDVQIENYGRPLVNLPYHLDFEDMSVAVSYGDGHAIDNGDKMDFSTSSQSAGNYQVLNGSNSSAIDEKTIVISSAGTATNELSLNLNLTNYSAHTVEIILSFEYKNLSDETSPEDKIYMRGSENDPWITLLDWNTGDYNQAIQANINISDSLQANGQDFSNSTQIRFGQSGTDNFPNDGLALDNISVREFFPNDLAIEGLDLNSSRTLSANEELTVVIENFGSTDQSNFDVTYQIESGTVVTETVSRTVASLDTIHYTFTTTADLSATSIYDITASTALATDEFTANDNFTLSVEKYPNAPIQMPFSIDFEDETTYLHQGDTSYFGDGRRFDFTNYLDRGQLQIINNQYSVSGKSLGLSSVDQSQQFLFLNLNMKDYAVADNRIIFDFDYKNTNDNYDVGDKVQIRGSVDDAWIDLLNWNTGEYNTVIHQRLNISDSLLLNGQEFSTSTQIRFIQDGRSILRYDGLVIDNLSWKEDFQTDLGVISTTLPASSLDFTNNESLTVDIHNFGYEAQSAFDLYYQIDNTTPVQETLSLTLNPEDTSTYTFSTPFDLSAEKEYNIKIWTSLAGDNRSSNDTLSMIVEHTPLIPFPYSEDFESNNGDWSASGVSSTWAYGVPEKLGYNATMANSAWSLGGLIGQYNSNELSTLTSPYFDLTAVDTSYLAMDLSYDFDSSYDYLKLQYSTDQGATWADLTTGVRNWFTGQGWSSSSNGINEVMADISHLKSFDKIRFRLLFDSDNVNRGSGAIIDNIRLESYTKSDLALASTSLESSRSLKNNEELIVDIANLGVYDQQNFDIYYQVDGASPVMETVAATAAANDTLTYSFNALLDLGSDKVYQINVWTDLTTDEKRANDTLSIAVEKYPNPVVNLPLSLNFENDQTFFKEGDSLFISDEERLDFFTANEVGSIQVFSGNQFAIDNKSLAMTGNSSQVDQNDLIWNLNLQNYSVSNNKITFDFDYIDVYDEDQLEDKVYIRGSKTEPWIELLDWNTFNEGTVLHASLNISDSLLAGAQEFSNSTQIKFTQNVNGAFGAEGLVLDNLILAELELADVGVIATSIPTASGVFTSTESLTVDLYNYAYNDQQNFDVYYQVDEATPVQESLSEMIASEDTLSFTFNTALDLSVEKDYTIKVWTALGGDENQSNDTLTISTAHYAITSLPYAEAFENDNGNWTAGGTNSSWVYGQPNKLGYNSTQANLAWALGGLDDQYNNNELSYIESPLFDVTNIDSTYLAFDINYDMESGWDYLKLQFSADDGASWITLTPGLVNWQNNNGWTGASNQLVRAKADITALKSFNEVKFRFYFESDGSAIKTGAIIDNIEIKAYPTDDISILSLDSNLQSSRHFTEDEAISVDIYNNGINSQQNFDIYYQINSEPAIQETVSSVITGLDTLTYTFTNSLDLSTVGSYDIIIWTGLNGDMDQSNDTIKVSFDKYPNPAVSLPLMIDFENDSSFLTEGDTTLFGDEERFDFFTANGTGQVQVFTGSNAIDNKSLGIASSSQDNNALILNLNLSNYTVEANKILFNFDYKNLGDEYDAADKVFIRGSENDPWITLYDWNTTNEYTIINVSVNISDSLLANGQAFSNTTQIKFGQSDNVELGQDGLVIDNLSFTELSSDDIGVVSTDLVSSGLFTASENLSVGIFNYGKLAQQGFDIYYQIDNGQVIQETVTEIVNPLNTLNYSFGNMLDLSAEKTYQIKVWTSLLNDSDQSNDSLNFSVEHFPVIELPYTQDFEAGDGDWIAGGNNSSWEYGVPTKLGYDSIQNNKAWALGGLSGDYNNTELSYIESPIFNLTQIDSAYISADINYNLESGYDYLKIQYSTDLGNTWVTLNNGLSNWYTGNGWSSSNEIQALADISALAGFEGVKFRFYFSSDGSYTSSGAIIDNIEVKPYPSVDMTLTDYSFTVANDSLGSAESIDVTVFNLGQEYNNAVIEYSLNNEQVHRDTVNVVGALEVQTITLSNVLDFTVQCANQLRVSLIVENDIDQTNNILEDLIYTNSNIVENLILEDSMEVCINQAIIQLESEISNGTWTGNGVSESGAFDPLTAGVGIHEILFETFEEGCSNFDSIIINVKEVISGSVDKSVEGQLTAPEAVSYRWFRDRAFINETSQTIEIQKSGNYEVELTNEVGCTSIIEVGQVLGNNTVLNEDHYTVYPNPAREYIMINVIPDLTEVRAQLYSLDGRLIWEKPIVEIQTRMEVNRIYSWTYILKIISNEGIATEKIIVY